MNTPTTTIDPPRRHFGSFVGNKTSRPTSRPSSSSSSTAALPASTLAPSPTATLRPPAHPQRTRSASSAASGQDNGPPAFDITSAADKAQQWLSGWAPRGEGRGREFLLNGLNGVASVASQVSNGLNVRHERDRDARSDSNLSTNGYLASSSASASPSTSPEGRLTLSTSPSGHLQAQAMSQSAAAQTNVGRRIPQPANLARLGHAVTTSSSPASSSGPSTTQQPPPPGLPHLGSTTSLPTAGHRSSIHGPSHLGPLVPTHHRTSSSQSHNRPMSLAAGSFGLNSSKSPPMSRSSSMSGVSAGPSLRSAGIPYKPGFQPHGVRYDRTEEYMDARAEVMEERDKEEGRLSRRWAKLVELHFNPTVSQPSVVPPSLTRSSSSNFSLSTLASDKRKSLISIDFDSLKPKDMFKGFKAGSGPGGDEGKKRAAEQALVKWEEDSHVKKCRICASTFTLSNRKHHCRLCGRIVCALPPTPPALLAVQVQLFAPADPNAKSTQSQAGLPPGTRWEKCSLLLVADYVTGRGEEVEEGFVGWMQMETGQNGAGSHRDAPGTGKHAGTSIGAIHSQGPAKEDVLIPQQPKEVQVKGMRACRECWAIVSRKQKMQDRQRVSGFSRLYQTLRDLQSEIDDLFIDFEDHLSELTESLELVEPSSDLLKIHARLITLFTQYEHLSKRISSLPCKEGGSQAHVQSAVARSAATFMAKEMVKLQTVPRIQKRLAETKRKGMTISETTLGQLAGEEAEVVADEVEDVAIMLQPLLEQEAQLELYVADANAQRKYEDGKALQDALKEIRAEIERITKGASR